MTENTCFFCDADLAKAVSQIDPSRLLFLYSCPNCGEYIADHLLRLGLGKYPTDDRSKIRACLLERQLYGRGMPYLFEKQSEIPANAPENSLGLDFVLNNFPRQLPERINSDLPPFFRPLLSC